MKEETKGGVPRPSEIKSLVRKPRNAGNVDTPFLSFPIKGKQNNIRKLVLKPCFVILGLDTLVVKHDFFCKRARCKVAEEKQPNSTKLKLVKKWSMTGKGGNKTTTGIFECPNCHKRTRKYNIGGSKQ